MSHTHDEYRRLVDEMIPAQRIERAMNLLAIDIYPSELITGELDRTVQLPAFDGTSIPVVALQDLILSKLL